jgi:hypothetical protein
MEFHIINSFGFMFDVTETEVPILEATDPSTSIQT